VIAYIDGGARGNPGPAAYGVRIEGEAGALLAELTHCIGVATNNVAEYRALIAALEYLRAQGYRRVEIRSDSELLVRQMLDQYRVKQATLQTLHDEARRIAASLERVTYHHIPRSENAEADRLVNEALDEPRVDPRTRERRSSP
ncbi:MAG: ribonuclease HI family protein, partial [Acidimicrobiia bacterium]